MEGDRNLHLGNAGQLLVSVLVRELQRPDYGEPHLRSGWELLGQLDHVPLGERDLSSELPQLRDRLRVVGQRVRDPVERGVGVLYGNAVIIVFVCDRLRTPSRLGWRNVHDVGQSPHVDLEQLRQDDDAELLREGERDHVEHDE